MAARLTALAVTLIVAVTLVAGLIVGAQRDDETGPIDLLIYNGRVYTGEHGMPFAEALAVRGNRIYRVGSNREIKRLRRLATTVIDAHGGSVLPGFTYAHARLPLGEAAGVRTETVAATSDAAGAPSSPGPTTAPTRDPLARRALDDAIEGAHRLGVTGLSTVAEHASDLDAYGAAQREASLPLRVVAAIRVAPPVDAAALDRLDALRAEHADDPLFRVDAVALRIAVPVESPKPSRRAGPARVNAEHASTGLPAETQRALEALDRRGWTVVLQVDDARSLAAAVDGLALLARTAAPPSGGRRHRIEIARPMPLDLARVKALGIPVALPLPDSWPLGAVLVDAAADATDDGASTAAAAQASEPHGGLTLLVASDTLADPRLGLQALATRRPSDPAEEPVASTPVDEAALAAAINAYTRTAAWAVGDERRRGTIARDKLADIVVLSADLFALPSDKLLDAVVTMTIFDGKVVYDREADVPHTEP